jgi:hypothetical protein
MSFNLDVSFCALILLINKIEKINGQIILANMQIILVDEFS